MRTLVTYLALCFLLTFALAAAEAPAAGPVPAGNPPHPSLALSPAPAAICPLPQPKLALPAPKPRPLDGTVSCDNCLGADRQCNRICWQRGECEYSCEADATTCELVSCICLPC